MTRSNRWIAEHPGADLQQLRSLIRAARKDAAAAAEQRSGRAYREAVPFIKTHTRPMSDPPAIRAVRIGLVSISDRASAGVYEDKGIPALQAWLTRALRNPVTWETD